MSKYIDFVSQKRPWSKEQQHTVPDNKANFLHAANADFVHYAPIEYLLAIVSVILHGKAVYPA